MKKFLMVTTAFVFGSGALLMAQNAPASNTQAMGRGRGGVPHAWNDKNKDGICDVTGAPVGQGRGGGAMRCGRRGQAAVAGRGMGAGRGAGAGAGAGWGRGMARGFRAQPQAATAPAPAQK